MRAIAKYIRISPRKISPVLDLIRKKSVKLALGILENTRKSSCEPIIKLLNSAVANAINNNDLMASKLYVGECIVTPGPTARRTQPVSKGRGHKILKRSSHISITLYEKKEGGANNGPKN